MKIAYTEIVRWDNFPVCGVKILGYFATSDCPDYQFRHIFKQDELFGDTPLPGILADIRKDIWIKYHEFCDWYRREGFRTFHATAA